MMPVFETKLSSIIPFEKGRFSVVSSALKSPPTAAIRKGPRGEVRIFATWCKGCQICVEFCPTKVLAMHPNGNYPIVVAGEKCTACHFCDTHCPDLAISVKKIE
jgi:2-oxoglutarate ferredoxin oxidoreductase subunit delta